MTSTHSTLRRAQKLERRGRVDDALATFEESDSGDPRLLVQHALALARAGRGEEAVRKIDRARAAAPDDAVPALFAAHLTLRFGEGDAAGDALRRAEELAPRNPIVPTLRAAEAIVRGQVREGCEALLAGPVTDNLEILGWVLARVESELFKAVGSDSGAVPPEPETPRRDEPPDDLSGVSVAKCMRRGERLLETGRPKSAAAHLARAMEKKPDAPALRVLYGAALAESGRFQEADAQLRQVPSDSPLGDVGQLYRAAVAYRLGQYDTALELLDTLPTGGDVFLYQEWCDYIRGMILVALGRTGEAAGHLARFLDVEPGLLDRRLGKAIDILGKQKEEPCSTPS